MDTPPGPDSSRDADLADAPAEVAYAPADVIDLPSPLFDVPPKPGDAPWPAIDATTPSEVSPADAPVSPCRVLPAGASPRDGGLGRWLWRYDPQVADLLGLCTSYGAQPKLILEVVVPGASNPLPPLPICTAAELDGAGARACSVGNAYRFVADCAAADMLVELPTDQPDLLAYVHVESAAVPSSPRQLAAVDSRCQRQLVGGVSPWSGTLPARDAGASGPEAGADAGDAAACTSYPSTSRVDSAGKTYWWFNFDWRQDNLADICASYGAGAKMVVELRGSTPSPIAGLPTCTAYEAMGAGERICAAGARLEADCLAGQMLFEADSERGIELFGYFHIESSQYPDPPRRLLEPDRTCQRALHPRFVPMAPAGSPDVGVDTGGLISYVTDPSWSGQPCQINADCPMAGQECFIDAAITDCLAGPIGRCVPFLPSNCVASWIGCYCLRIPGGTLCNDDPSTACGNLYPPGTSPPVNPQSGTLCHACLPG